MLAPYNNSMRLGQGFNSFTQKIRMTDAVTEAKSESSSRSEDQQPKGISQIVSYSSRFVDKLSDVTDVMNVSASLSIKTGTIGGAVSGTYIDSDKFKTSDLNFFIQVKVTNQTHMAHDYTEFSKLKNLPVARFTEIYGDSFIAGWEEGGEPNALISVKILSVRTQCNTSANATPHQNASSPKNEAFNHHQNAIIARFFSGVLA
ncbi:hypothetical protein COCMIDRAFT_108993 [Bipolaris oryzae ATCC 44560]|uniref:MACPF domain-containing protein n=1 Tax=Bipolaris oryzae ATCC 44560 TaxID=930090 RepID=W6YM89_COCMI|nr:uncharacterized protein COCMIDRAFT_108993 [Bipolaris oryzae ATCC 44560]EUC40362.1 hypothetical protein COCMIDRAFT_108993 [Bipolaris oryzae ATCC 44560]